MATRLKTIEFAFTQLDSLTDNTLTALTQITMYIPEFSGTVTFKSCVVTIAVQEKATTTTGDYTSRRIDVSVGGAGATSYTNANVYTGSGENTTVYYSANCTAHFVSNWTSGTSKTLDVSVLLDGTATTIAFGGVSATIFITYEYDDTQTTQIKTVRIPLNAPVGLLATSKPGSATDTIPALDTELPETSKTYRNMFITCQGNVNAGASATDSTLSMQIDALTAYVSQTLEMGAASDYWTRFVWNITALGMTTNATHGFYIWGSIARHNHQQAWLTVTYEFDASGSTDTFVSLMLPMEIVAPMGGTTSADYQRGNTELWIQEAGLATKQIAFYSFWEKAAAIAGLNMRVGTGSFVTYTNGTGGTLCGNDGAMCRNDAAFTLARGRNTLNFDIYRTDATDTGMQPSGFWIVNYTADKPSQGYGAANHTVFWNMGATFDGAAATPRIITATAPVIPESSYFMNCAGGNYKYITDAGALASGVSVLAEKTSGEGNVAWLNAYCDLGWTDGETGLRQVYFTAEDIFKQYPTDPTSNLLDIETSRRWQFVKAGGAINTFDYLDLIFTYHTISYAISGTITGSAGGTVTIKAYSDVSKKEIGSTSRSGNGSYSITWYDDVEDVFTVAFEDATHVGASDAGVAA